MKERVKVTQEMCEKLAEMRAQGINARTVAATLGIAMSTASKMLSRLPKPPAKEKVKSEYTPRVFPRVVGTDVCNAQNWNEQPQDCACTPSQPVSGCGAHCSATQRPTGDGAQIPAFWRIGHTQFCIQKRCDDGNDGQIKDHAN